MQFSKSAGKHWTELPLSLSFIFLRRALYPPSPFTPLDLSLAALYPRPSTNSLSGRRRHIHSLSLSPHFRRWDIRANLYLLFRWNLRHTAIRRIFWSNCSPREKRSFVKYASHSSDCNRRMRNACESTPSGFPCLLNETSKFHRSFPVFLWFLGPVRSGKRWSLSILELIRD